MRQLAHSVLGAAFWAVLLACWLVLGLEHKATAEAFRDTLLQLAVVMGAVLAITIWWIRHNVGIYRRKGPRRGRAEEPPRTDEDRLGRRIQWAMPGGARTAQSQQHLVVELDGDAKLYRRER
jgi:hypothetical protein